MRTAGIFIFILFYFYSFSQTEANKQDVNLLLNEKKELISKKKSTRDVDLKIYNAGVLPSAQIVLTNDNKTISFDLFRDYSKINTSNIEARIRQMFPTLTTCNLDFTNKICSFTFSEAPDEDKKEQLVKIFSYNGYTIKK